MIMKKLFFFAAVALTFAACTKTTLDESAAPDVPVTFQAANYTPATKVGEVSVFNDFKEFKSLAYLHAVGVDLNPEGSQIADNFQNFFGTSGETISPYDASNTKITDPTPGITTVSYWAPSHNYYWPKDSKSYVNFVAWYGTDGTNAVNPAVSYEYVSSKWKATMTWSFSNETVGAAGANLLYADMAWRYNETPNKTYGLNGVTKGVPMLFHHALAQINVKAYALKGTDPSDAQAITAGSGTVTDETATWTIKLKNVKITPIIKAGTLALTNEDPGTNETRAWTGTWAARSGSTAGALIRSGEGFAVDKVSKATAGDLIAATCVVPQTIGTDVVLSFDLDITTAYGGGVSHHEIIPISIKLNDMGTTAWAMNTKYTYYLQINPSQKTVLFDPAVEADWVEGTTTEKII